MRGVGLRLPPPFGVDPVFLPVLGRREVHRGRPARMVPSFLGADLTQTPVGPPIVPREDRRAHGQALACGRELGERRPDIVAGERAMPGRTRDGEFTSEITRLAPQTAPAPLWR